MGMAWFFNGLAQRVAFAPAQLRPYYGNPLITGPALNNWQANNAAFYGDAVESVLGFSGDGAARAQLIAQTRGVFCGLAEAGIVAQIAVATGATSNELTIYSNGGTDYYRYRYDPGDIIVISRIGNDGRIEKADGSPFISLADGQAVYAFNRPGCFTPGSAVRFLAYNTESVSGGNAGVQLQGNLQPF